MIFTEYPNDFWHKKIDNFDPYNVLFATNIPKLLMTGFVVQGHKCFWKKSLMLTKAAILWNITTI